MKIAVLGPAGTFCDKAYMEYEQSKDNKDGKLEAFYCQTIDDVFENVCAGEMCDIGVVPIENTLDGYVQRTLDLLLEQNVEIISENKIPVKFSLVTNVAEVKDIERLFVQFKANGQCRKFINSLEDVAIVSTESNMESYYKVDDFEKSGAIVPCHVVEGYEGGVVIDNVTDSKNNFTRFVIFRRKQETKISTKMDDDSSYRVPAYIMPTTDRPGILFEILECFYKKQINLISIMSRPTKQVMGTYNFYIEIEANFEKLDEIKSAFEFIRENNDVKILGIFNKV